MVMYYDSGEDSDPNVSLCVAYYNFLRLHYYTYLTPLNSIPELESVLNITRKLQKRI